MKKKFVLLIISIFFISTLVSSTYAFKWNNIFKQNVVLDLYTYNDESYELYKKLSKDFSLIYPHISFNIINNTNDKYSLEIPTDQEGRTSFNLNNNNLLPVIFDGNGVIYSKKIFNELNLQVPKTFRELEQLCSELFNNNIVPFANNSKNYSSKIQNFIKANTRPFQDKMTCMDFVTLKEFNENSDKYKNYGFMPLPTTNDCNKNYLYVNVDVALMVYSDSQQSIKDASSYFLDWLKLNGEI